MAIIGTGWIILGYHPETQHGEREDKLSDHYGIFVMLVIMFLFSEYAVLKMTWDWEHSRRSEFSEKHRALHATSKFERAQKETGKLRSQVCELRLQVSHQNPNNRDNPIQYETAYEKSLRCLKKVMKNPS